MRIGPIILSTAVLTTLTACARDPGPDLPPKPYAIIHVYLNLDAPTGRNIPMRVFLPPEDCSPCDVIIFSHGAYSTYGRYDVLLEDWAEHGYVVAAPLHVDSEEHPDRALFKDVDSQPLRLEDYVAASDMFAAPDYSLNGLHFSGTQIAAGHSYGGLIAEIAGGAEASSGGMTFTGAAIAPSAIIALSPPGVMSGRFDLEGYSKISKPLLVVTGTTDTLPGFIDDWQTHLDSFEASQTSMSYALIFDQMNHYFNGAFCRITPEGANSTAAINTLNSQILAFLRAVSDEQPPSGDDWTQAGNPLVRTLTK